MTFSGSAANAPGKHKSKGRIRISPDGPLPAALSPQTPHAAARPALVTTVRAVPGDYCLKTVEVNFASLLWDDLRGVSLLGFTPQRTDACPSVSHQLLRVVDHINIFFCVADRAAMQ